MHLQATLSFAVFLAVVYPCAAAVGCTNPKATADVFATSDLVANSTVIVNVDVRCDKVPEKEFTVYGVLEPSRLLLVGSRVENAAGSGLRFQISFVDSDDTTLVSGADQNTLHVYDDHGYAAYRKAVREGQDTSAISPLVTVAVTKPQRPNRFTRAIAGEHCALFIGVMSIYSLYTLKSKLTN